MPYKESIFTWVKRATFIAVLKVVGMDVAEQWVYWSGEKSLNFDENKGVHPKVERQKYPFTYTKLFYCYYTPKKRGKRSAKKSIFEVLYLNLFSYHLKCQSAFIVPYYSWRLHWLMLLQSTIIIQKSASGYSSIDFQ